MQPSHLAPTLSQIHKEEAEQQMGEDDFTLRIEFPMYEYRRHTYLLYPFDPVLSHNGNFNTLNEAIMYIYAHCMHHHGTFRRKYAMQYLDYCFIFNPLTATYEQLDCLSKEEFENAYHYAIRNA